MCDTDKPRKRSIRLKAPPLLVIVSALVLAACSSQASGEPPVTNSPDHQSSAEVSVASQEDTTESGTVGESTSDAGAAGGDDSSRNEAQPATTESNPAETRGSAPEAPRSDESREPAFTTPDGNTPAGTIPGAPLVGPPAPGGQLPGSSSAGDVTSASSENFVPPTTNTAPPLEPRTPDRVPTTRSTSSFLCVVTLTSGSDQGTSVWWADITAPQRLAVWMVSSTSPGLGRAVRLLEGSARVALPRSSTEVPVVRIYESPSLEGTLTGCRSR